MQRQSQASPEVTASYTSAAGDEELTLEEQVRRRNEAVMKESMKALARQRNSSFARAAAKKTVADFQSDSESEEDPDPEPTKTFQKDHAGNDNQSVSDESDPDDDTADDEEASAGNGLSPDEHDAQTVQTLPDMTASFEHRTRPNERHNRRKKPQPDISSAARGLINDPNYSEDQLVMLYIVKKELTFNGKELAVKGGCKEEIGRASCRERV